jgi:glycosyltransferase involved in cell wall biosynthesis
MPYGLRSTLRPFVRKAYTIKKRVDAARPGLVGNLVMIGLWRSIYRYRPLFCHDLEDLHLYERVARRWATSLMGYCENRAAALPALQDHIDRPQPRSEDLSQLTCMMIIGSLGAGGAERQLVTLLEELHRRQTFKRLVVGCLNLSTPAANFHRPTLEALGVEIVDLQGSAEQALPQHHQGVAKSFPAWARNRMPSYCHAIDRIRPDILQLWMDECNVIGGLSGIVCGVPAILLSARSQAPYHFAFHQPWMREGYRAILQQPRARLYANSERGAQDYAHWLQVDRDDIHHVFNGVAKPQISAETPTAEHAQLLQRLAQDRHGKTLKLMAVGRLSEEKQPFYLIEMFKEILKHEPDAHLLWVGDGPLAQKVDTALGGIAPGHVTRAGHSRQVSALMAMCDAVVLPSRIEGLPNVLIEAQALGRPVFTPAAGGAIETFEDGVSGLVLPARAPRHAGQLVVTHMRQGKISAQAATMAPDFVAERFDAETMAANTIGLYRSLITTC